ncbi:hypothetical protein [Burkholderia cepacia]|uniref:hypothetical protein n=1 Tax=Burkholderia cepacia TaxID=292 RepID=UPI001CF12CE8|nr:hypothetical protein [Burkholderia cepacia]MCA8351453.1 hypothetical protein [Burkholderia cepacia]
MSGKDGLVEVCVYLDKEWLETIDIGSLDKNDTFEESASWLPIHRIYSKQKFEEMQKRGYDSSIPDATVVLAKIELDDLIGCASNYSSGKLMLRKDFGSDFNIHFELEDGKFKIPDQAQQSSSKPKMR